MRSLSLCLVASLTSACNVSFSEPSPDGVRGDLANGNFVYECVGTADGACEDDTFDVLASGIAVGGEFRVEYFENGSDSFGGFAAEPVAKAHIQSGFNLRALRAGPTGLVARLGSRVVDFTTVELVDIARVTALDVESGKRRLDHVALEPGDRLRIRAVPEDSRGEPLAGALRWTFEVEDETIAELSSAERDNEIEVLARAEGDTALVIQAEDALSMSVSINVSVAAGGTP